MQLIVTILNIFLFLGQFLGFSGSLQDVQLTTIFPFSSIILSLRPVGPFSKSVPLGKTLMIEVGLEFWVTASLNEGLSSLTSSSVVVIPALEADSPRIFPIIRSSVYLSPEAVDFSYPPSFVEETSL